MLQEEYKLSVSAGEEVFLQGVEMLLAQKKQESAERGDSAVYIHLICTAVSHPLALAMADIWQRIWPEAVVTGLSETIFDTDSQLVSMVRFNFTYMARSRVQLLVHKGCDGDYRQIGLALGRKMAGVSGAKAAAVYTTGMSSKLYQLIGALGEGNEELVIFGASAGMFEYNDSKPFECTNLFYDLNDKNRLDQQFIFGNEFLASGVVVVVFFGDDLCVRGDYIFGWKPLGKELTITETLGDNCILRIEDMPAVEIYNRYLKVTPDENFMYNIAEFPLAVERNGCLIARVPPRYDEDGRLYFSSDIYQGEKLRLTYAVHDDLLHETENYSTEMCAFAPKALFLMLCGNRTIFLKEMAGNEIDYYRRFALHPVVNYGTSEIFLHKGKGGILNSALIAVGMREGEACYDDDCYQEIMQKPKEHRIVPLAERMAAFLDAVTKELADSYRDLAAMAKAAEAASVAKSQFLSGMSHEIRTPINAVLGMDEMILRETKEESTREYAQNIRAAGTTLLGLVNDILDFSKIEAGKMEIIPVEYAVSSILNDLANMIRQRAEKKGLTFHVEVPEDMPSILKGDEIRLRQVAVNILTNAVKYTEEGSVTLRLTYKKIGENRIALTTSVKDTGIGIKEEDIEKLYHAFERIEEERNRTVEGTGLGMNITKKLLEMMDSHLEVASVYGEGSEFSYTVEQEVLNWSPMGNYEEAYRRMMAAQTAYKESFVAPEAKILVVDDTAMNLTVVRGLLKQTMVQVETVLSGYECLARAEKEHFDLIFLDHRMPGLDGIETLHRLQQLNQQENALNAHTPVVALTANAVSGAREEYIAAGFDDYLTKPIDSHKLEDLLRSMLPPEKVRVAGVLAVAAEEKLPDWLEYVSGLEPHKGVEHCGSVAAYLDALRVFAESIESNADEIQRYFETEDCRNYTTKVHALKSTARVIGATELSEKARRLEDAGNNGYAEEIKANTLPLLELYRSFAASLSPIIPEVDTEEKSPISPEELAEAWEAMGEIAVSFDYDSLMYMLGELSGYQLPSADAEKLAKVKKAAAVPDWAALQKILS